MNNSISFVKKEMFHMARDFTILMIGQLINIIALLYGIYIILFRNNLRKAIYILLLVGVNRFIILPLIEKYLIYLLDKRFEKYNETNKDTEEKN